jgi:hypothetical protein
MAIRSEVMPYHYRGRFSGAGVLVWAFPGLILSGLFCVARTGG